MNIIRFISKTLLLAVTCSSMTALVSCEGIEGEIWERPNDLSSYIPDYCVSLTGSWSASGNSASFNIKPSISADFDYWQLRIISIDYYIDDVFIKTETQEPYSFDYTAPGLSAGHHQLIANIKIEDLVNHNEIVVSATKDFEVGSSSGPDTSEGLLYSASYSKSGNIVYFDINDIRIWSPLASSGWILTTVSFYLDDILIETLNEGPFNFAYTARDLSQGNHTLIIKGKIVNTSNAQEMELIGNMEVTIP